ncbi:MAG: CoA transferase, partial [Desulfobacteraceae bacterium]|nr:CoA transferase [Desulfobacteraceae bacterium]
VVDFDYDEFGSFKIPGYPVHFSTFQAGTKTGAPKIGEHTDLIMGKMGYTAEQIDELRKEGIIN